MEETPATQYISSDGNPIYHIARNESMSFCGLALYSKRDQRRRRDDLRLSAEKPTKQFQSLCSKCQRRIKGLPEPKRPDPGLLSPSRLIVIVP